MHYENQEELQPSQLFWELQKYYATSCMQLLVLEERACRELPESTRFGFSEANKSA